MRRSAGVAHVTVFTKPDICGGNCLYCPKVPDVPKSYLPHSNVALQGLSYSSEEQMRHWIGQIERKGKTADKLEVLILGGSFTAHKATYAMEFLAGVYRGSGDAPGSENLEQIVANHESSAGRRIVGITVESRPNLITREVVERLFSYGVTKIELGVQSLDDEVLKFNDRGHDAAEVARATKVIKDFGLKVGYHLLLGMPGASMSSDILSAKRLFQNGSYQPDHLKIYVCEMFRREFMRGRLVKLYDAGDWRPLENEARAELLGEIISLVPSFTRISRIGRKIAGDEMESELYRIRRDDIEKASGCRCVRCREPLPGRRTSPVDVVITSDRISDREIFIEARPEGGQKCLGLLRLRLGTDSPAVVRELHVYGLVSPRGKSGPHQHVGIGRRLMAAAEDIARAENVRPELFVASGVGVRAYYRALGYSLLPSGMMRKTLGEARFPLQNDAVA